MKLAFLLFTVYVMGFFTAIPVGATQVEVVRRSLVGYVRSALMVVIGAVFSDAIYGFIAFFGIAPFLRDKVVMSIFWLAASVLIFALGFITYRNRNRTTAKLDEIHDVMLQNWGISFLTGFSLSITNPLMIFWWLAVGQIVRDMGLVDAFTFTTRCVFILSGAAGIATYLVVLSSVIDWAKKFISDTAERRINTFLSIVLFSLGIYFVVRSLHVLIE